MRPFRVSRWALTSCCGHGWRSHGAAAVAAAPRARASRTAVERPSAAVAATVEEPAPQARHYPPPPPAISPVDGLIDFHVHTAPDVFSRALDDDEAIGVARSRGMEAVVLKSHTSLTADRAWLVRKHVPGIKVFGGITLNGAAGGINAEAVRWMWRMQGGYGRVVWFPTFDADNHVTRYNEGPAGIKVVDGGGNVLPPVLEVLKVCAEQNLVVHTGHSSAREALAIIAAAREAGCDRVVVTHVEFDVVGMDVEQMKKAAAMGAKMEIAALGIFYGPNAPLPFLRNSPQVPVRQSAEHIRAVGAEHFILSTDLGQLGNPSPADGYAMLVTGLMAEGITKDEIRAMGRENPGRLLMG